MNARIYRPSKTAMQSARGNISEWVLEYKSSTVKKPEPLMGWTSCGDTLGQIRLEFKTLDEARAYAEKKGLVYSILSPQPRKLKPRNYTDNFRYRSEDEV